MANTDNLAGICLFKVRKENKPEQCEKYVENQL